MSEPFLGEIRIIGFNFAPRGWMRCEGQELDIASNQALFSIIGTLYGGNGRTNFALPDLRSRAPIHPGAGPGLPSFTDGQRGGQERVTLAANELPSHNHILRASSEPADSTSPADQVIAKQRRFAPPRFSPNTPAANVALASGTSTTGGGQAHENRQPQLGMYFIIAVTGVFPSRS